MPVDEQNKKKFQKQKKTKNKNQSCLKTDPAKKQ